MTRQELCSIPEGSMEEYVVSFPAMLGRTKELKSVKIRINAPLYQILKKLNMEADYSNITLLTTAILSKGVQTFRNDYISDDTLKMLQMSSLNNDNLNGMVNDDWAALRRFENQNEVAHVFKSVMAKNWNINMKSKTVHHYEISNLSNAFSNMAVFGFDEKNGSKALREFIIMLGLRSSVAVQSIESIYEKIVTITDATLEVFDTLLEREHTYGRGEGW